MEPELDRPAPQPAPERQAQRRTAPWRAMIGAVVFAGAAALGANLAGFDVMSLGSSDAGMTEAQAAAREATFTAAGPINLPEVPEQQRNEAVKSMQLPAPQEAALKGQVEARQIKLVYVTLWDDRDED